MSTDALEPLALLEEAFQHAPVGKALVAPDGRWLKVNPALCDLVGYREAELLTLDFQSITHPDDLATDLGLVNRLLRGETDSYQLEKRYLHRNGGVVLVLLNVTLVRSETGEPRFFISQIQNITEQKRAFDVVRLANARLNALIEHVPSGLVMADETGTIVHANRLLCLLFSLQRGCADLAGRTVDELFHSIASRLIHPLQWWTRTRELLDRRTVDSNDRYELSDGRVIERDFIPIKLSGTDAGTVWVFRDVTREVAAERQHASQTADLKSVNRQLRQWAEHDELTGLHNRRVLHQRFAQLERNPVPQPVSVIVVDIDHFKTFNDSFGHLQGDRVLAQVAELLRQSARASDTVIRMGGEEFVLLLPGAEAGNALGVANRCRAAVEQWDWPLRGITVSIGVATAVLSQASPPVVSEQLLKAADRAMYHSKSAGRNRVTETDEPVTCEPQPAC